MPTTLMAVAHLTATQPQFSSASAKAISALLALPNLITHLSQLSARKVRLTPLLALLLQALASDLVGGSNAADVLTQLLQEMPMDGLAEGLAVQLLQAAEKAAGDPEGRLQLQAVLRQLDLR